MPMNIAKLLITKNIYFVPYGQDAPSSKTKFFGGSDGFDYGNM